MMIGMATSMHGITIKSLLNDLPPLSVFAAVVVGASVVVVVAVVQLVVEVISSTVVTYASIQRNTNKQKDCGPDVRHMQHFRHFQDYDIVS